MVIFKILKYPHKNLRRKAQPVKLITHKIKKNINIMINTMNKNYGIGLAAPQINLNLAIIIVKHKLNLDHNLIFINPIMIKQKGIIKSEEGCLSIPNILVNINRYQNITIKALNYYGNKIIFNAKNDLAKCIQHEIDHLHGILCIDYNN